MSVNFCVFGELGDMNPMRRRLMSETLLPKLFGSLITCPVSEVGVPYGDILETFVYNC